MRFNIIESDCISVLHTLFAQKTLNHVFQGFTAEKSTRLKP